MATMTLQPGLYGSAVVLLGLIGGWLFHAVWRILLPRGRNRELLTPVLTHLRGMTSGDDAADLLRHYRLLLVALGRYAARNLLAVFAAAIPATLLYFFIAELDILGPSTPLPPDRNPFAAWLSDMEFVFFIAATVGSIGAVVWSRLRGGGR